MEIITLIEAGEKLGLKGAELKAWADEKAKKAHDERAQACEADSHRLELQREVLDKKLSLEEFRLNKTRLQGTQGSIHYQDLIALPFNDCVSSANLSNKRGSNLVGDLQERRTYAKAN